MYDILTVSAKHVYRLQDRASARSPIRTEVELTDDVATMALVSESPHQLDASHQRRIRRGRRFNVDGSVVDVNPYKVVLGKRSRGRLRREREAMARGHLSFLLLLYCFISPIPFWSRLLMPCPSVLTWWSSRTSKAWSECIVAVLMAG